MAVGREQHLLRSLHLAMRPRVTRRAMLELSTLGLREDDLLSPRTWHR
jgi:hypothetical protein